MKKEENNVIKFDMPRGINIGSIIALFIIVIMLIQFYRYFTNPHLSVYEVLSGKSNSEVSSVGMIIRNETVYRTKNAGYLNYYYREGARVSKGSRIYSLNETSYLSDMLTSNGQSTMLVREDMSRLKASLRTMSQSYEDVNFSECYQNHEDILSDYLRYRDLSLLDSMNDNVISSVKGFHSAYSDQSGMVSYYSDKYDGYTVSDINGSEFLEENRVTPQRNSTSGLCGIDSFAYKIVDDLNWELVVQIPKEDVARILVGGSKVKFKISGDSTLYECSYTTFTVQDEMYLVIPMERYVKELLRSRFLDVVIYLEAAEGLKIPKTALTEKELYQIPERFVMNGGGEGSKTYGISVEYYDSESGEVAIQFQEIDYLFYEDGYYFVNAEDFPSERVVEALTDEEKPERAMLYSFITKMEGVYNVNKGYPVFKRIERMTDVDDYLLVKPGVSGGVSLYDHIILDTSVMSDDLILEGN